MGISMGNNYIVHIMSEYGLDMVDLVLTNLDHCWGPPWWFDALKSAQLTGVNVIKPLKCPPSIPLTL